MAEKTAEELAAEQAALDAEDMGGKGKAKDGQPTGDELASRRRGRSLDANGSGDEDGDDGEQTELPLNIPGAKRPTLGMNAKGKAVSVEGKMRGKSFKMSGVVDDTDRVMEARVLIRFHKDQRVPVRDGVGEAATTQSFILRQEFDVLRMDIITPEAAAAESG